MLTLCLCHCSCGAASTVCEVWVLFWCYQYVGLKFTSADGSSQTSLDFDKIDVRFPLAGEDSSAG